MIEANARETYGRRLSIQSFALHVVAAFQREIATPASHSMTDVDGASR